PAELDLAGERELERSAAILGVVGGGAGDVQLAVVHEVGVDRDRRSQPRQTAEEVDPPADRRQLERGLLTGGERHSGDHDRGTEAVGGLEDALPRSGSIARPAPNASAAARRTACGSETSTWLALAARASSTWRR